MISVIKIVEDTTVDGPGFRTTVYAAGCPNACPGCHNPQSWDIESGTLMTTEEIMQVIRADEFADVTFSGGDPMFQPEGFAELAEAVKRETGKNIARAKSFCTRNEIIIGLHSNTHPATLLSEAWRDVVVYRWV